MYSRVYAVRTGLSHAKNIEPNTLLFKRAAGALMAWIAGLIFLLTALGCSTMQPAVTMEQMAADPPPKETLVPGDVVDVKFFYTPELNEKDQMIRPDGTITLQLLGKVMAQGKTPEELKRELIKLYGPQLKKPEVEVIVRTKNDRKVYVGGEVKNPGVVEMPGELTALEAIKRAGGFNIPRGDASNVLIVRQKDGKQTGCVLDLKKVMEGQEKQAFFLQPHDVIYVPPTTIAKANNWVEQYITRMLPQISGVGAGLTIP
jgi:protein involved in polysaccharide export with SLBB domain